MYHRLMSHMDDKHKEKVFYLLNKYGILTLITARYIAFVRTVYPYIVGATEIPQGRFLVVNLVSSIMWITPLVSLGYYLSHTKLAAKYESQFLSIILYLPLVLLVGGIVALIWRWLSKSKTVTPRD
jgi:membrane protein DedA with SNARE-associated domain